MTHYPREIQHIFDLTLSLLDKDDSFDRSLFAKLSELVVSGKWNDETAISNAIDEITMPEERPNA